MKENYKEKKYYTRKVPLPIGVARKCKGILDDVEREKASWVIATFTNEKIMKITMKMPREILEITLRKEK